MPAFSAQTKLSEGDLRLYLTNPNGYPQDAFDVRWTVYASDGAQISGKNLCAIKANTGEYYAPWSVTDKTGNYFIQWQWQDESGDQISVDTEQFFVVNPSSYSSCGPITADGIPLAGEFSYLRGALLGPGDLPLYVKNDDGLPIDPFSVFWTIYDALGTAVTAKTAAVRVGVGEYYAYLSVNMIGGDYIITWEYMEQADSPIEAKSMPFSVINTSGLVCRSATVSNALACCTSCSSSTCSIPCTVIYVPIPPVPPMNQCCPYEIPRVVHLATQVLPAGGGWTNQPFYVIPERIRQLTFYITYVRGIADGYPEFKLLWGNGVEESQETMIDFNYTVSDPTATQNMYLQDLAGPIPDSNAPVNSIIHICVPGGALTARLIVAEKGQPGAPGSVGITLTAAS